MRLITTSTTCEPNTDEEKKQRINKEERNGIVTETESKVELCAVIMNVAYYSVHKILIAVCEYFFICFEFFIYLFFVFGVDCRNLFAAFPFHSFSSNTIEFGSRDLRHKATPRAIQLQFQLNF